MQVLDFDTGATISPQVAPAVITPEGYLEADAYVARDGLLQYSDGTRTWIEYRPTETLEAWAATGEGKPCTDDHPPAMLDATNTVEYYRGQAIAPLELVEDGEYAYLHTRLRWVDAALIDAIRSDEQSQISIGVLSRIYPGNHPDGTQCDAWQSGEGPGINHYAAVRRGRSGPTVRVFFDGADCLVPTHESMSMDMNQREDAVGAEAATVPVMLPDGRTLEVPTEIAELVELGLKAKKEQVAPPQAPPMAPPTEDAMPPRPMPPQAPPTEDGMMEPKKPEFTMDSVDQLVRERASLLRQCAKVGVPEAILDSADVPTLQRAYIKARTNVELAEDRDPAQVYEFVLSQPYEAPRKDSAEDQTLFGVRPVIVPRKDSAGTERPDAEKAYLRSQGYSV